MRFYHIHATRWLSLTTRICLWCFGLRISIAWTLNRKEGIPNPFQPYIGRRQYTWLIFSKFEDPFSGRLTCCWLIYGPLFHLVKPSLTWRGMNDFWESCEIQPRTSKHLKKITSQSENFIIKSSLWWTKLRKSNVRFFVLHKDCPYF